jgi:DNA-binding MarR family transcriptional regulator
MGRRKPASAASGKRLVADAREMIDACSGLDIRLAARRVTRFLEARLAESGLSLAQLGLMAHIAAAYDDTIGALAQRTGLDQSTLSRNLHALERAGLVEIAVIERDLRRRAVWLTERGARSLEATLPVWRSAQKALARLIETPAIRTIARATAVLDDEARRTTE